MKSAHPVTEKHIELHIADLPEFAADQSSTAAPLVGNLQMFKNVKVRLRVVAGEVVTSIGDLTELKTASILKLDRQADAPVDVLLEDQIIGRGELVVVGDNYGVRITELATYAL